MNVTSLSRAPSTLDTSTLAPPPLVAGDRVRLLIATHPKGPRAGSVGVVVIGDEGDERCTTLSVAFGRGIDGVPYQALEVFRHHLLLIQAAVEVPV